MKNHLNYKKNMRIKFCGTIFNLYFLNMFNLKKMMDEILIIEFYTSITIILQHLYNETS